MTVSIVIQTTSNANDDFGRLQEALNHRRLNYSIVFVDHSAQLDLAIVNTDSRENIMTFVGEEIFDNLGYIQRVVDLFSHDEMQSIQTKLVLLRKLVDYTEGEQLSLTDKERQLLVWPREVFTSPGVHVALSSWSDTFMPLIEEVETTNYTEWMARFYAGESVDVLIDGAKSAITVGMRQQQMQDSQS